MTRNNESTLERFSPTDSSQSASSSRRMPFSATRPSVARGYARAASASAPTSRVSGTGGGDSGLARLLAARARARPVGETRRRSGCVARESAARMARGRRAGARARASLDRRAKSARDETETGTGPTRDSRETRALDFRSPQNRPPRRYYSLLFIVVDGASTRLDARVDVVEDARLPARRAKSSPVPGIAREETRPTLKG